MTDESPDPSQTDAGADDSLGLAAGLAREVAGSATAAAGLAKTAGSEFWKALSSLGVGPLDAASNVAKQVTVTNSASAIVDGGVRVVKRLAQPGLNSDMPVDARVGASRRDEADILRKRGTKLVGISHKPELQLHNVHPSFSRILDELTPDEARIVRFLAVAGPQPVIDIRTKTLFQIGSELLGSRISMIAEMAGCRWWDRDRHYFANLSRLGLLRFSTEPVDDFRRYALIEVQPAAVLAMAKAKRSISIYRSLRLSEFGHQFVDVCFDTTGYHAGGWDTDERGDKIIGKGPPELRV